MDASILRNSAITAQYLQNSPIMSVYEVVAVVSCIFHFLAKRVETKRVTWCLLMQASSVQLLHGPPYPPLTPPQSPAHTHPPSSPIPPPYTHTHTRGFSGTIIFGNLIHRDTEIRLFESIPVVGESVMTLFQFF